MRNDLFQPRVMWCARGSAYTSTPVSCCVVTAITNKCAKFPAGASCSIQAVWGARPSQIIQRFASLNTDLPMLAMPF